MSLTPLDRAEKMIPLISLLYSSFLSNLIEEEILSFFVFSFLFPSKFPRNFSQILFSSLSFFLSRYECVCKERTKREGKRKPFFLSLDFSCFLPRLFLPSFLPYVAFPRMSRERDSHLTTVFHRGGGTQLYGYPGRIVHTLCFVCSGSGYFFYRPTSSLLFFSSSSSEEPGEKVSLGCRKKQSRSHLGTFAFLRLFV